MKKQKVFLIGGKPRRMTPSELQREIKVARPERYPFSASEVPQFSVCIGRGKDHKHYMWLLTRENLSGEWGQRYAEASFPCMGNA
jgi:hypothetical protein